MKKQNEKIYDYEVIFDPNGEGYTVTVPQLPGLVTEGRNLKESREMARDAIKCHLEGVLKDSLFASSKSSSLRKEKVKVGVEVQV